MTPQEVAKVRRAAGYALLGAALLVWMTAVMLAPHGESQPSAGVGHVRASVALFGRNASLGTLVLVMLSAAALFWRRRPTRDPADLFPLAIMALLAASSFYQLVWIETEVLDFEETQAAPRLSERT